MIVNHYLERQIMLAIKSLKLLKFFALRSLTGSICSKLDMFSEIPHLLWHQNLVCYVFENYLQVIACFAHLILLFNISLVPTSYNVAYTLSLREV